MAKMKGPIGASSITKEHTINLSLTDPSARAVYSAKKDADYLLKDVYLCVSLTEPYEVDGRCHKLVAAIIKDPPL